MLYLRYEKVRDCMKGATGQKRPASRCWSLLCGELRVASMQDIFSTKYDVIRTKSLVQNLMGDLDIDLVFSSAVL